jgi:uncharacterized protein YeaO (DUF488 family)
MTAARRAASKTATKSTQTNGAPAGRFQVKRIYAPAGKSDGWRVLVDRLWPRGIAREKARIDHWAKDIAPSEALRRRFHGNAAGWEEFVAAYAAELKAPAAQAEAAELRRRLADGPVTLLFAAREETRNNAVALADWLAGG